MTDLLVRLFDLPELETALTAAGENGITIRRALAPEKHLVSNWVGTHFSAAWASECEVAFARQPLACFLATREGQLCGFAAYEATCRNFFGPVGVHPDARAAGAGTALALAALHAMRAEGYAYAIIGAAAPGDFFRDVAGAIPIEGSEPGIYRGLLKR